MKLSFTLPALVLLLFGGGTGNALYGQPQLPPPQQPPEVTPNTPAPLPAPGEATAPADPIPPTGDNVTASPVDPNRYIIGAEDIVAIRVWKEPDLSAVLQVRPDNKITLPLVGDIEAAGLTPEQLKVKITEALSQVLTKPEVTVYLQAVRSKKYFITGEVNRTGAFPLVVPITIFEALVRAGGFREFANRKKITIIRGTERIRFNYDDVIKGKNLQQNIQVMNGDYIYVK